MAQLLQCITLSLHHSLAQNLMLVTAELVRLNNLCAGRIALWQMAERLHWITHSHFEANQNLMCQT